MQIDQDPILQPPSKSVLKRLSETLLSFSLAGPHLKFNHFLAENGIIPRHEAGILTALLQRGLELDCSSLPTFERQLNLGLNLPTPVIEAMERGPVVFAINNTIPKLAALQRIQQTRDQLYEGNRPGYRQVVYFDTPNSSLISRGATMIFGENTLNADTEAKKSQRAGMLLGEEQLENGNSVIFFYDNPAKNDFTKTSIGPGGVELGSISFSPFLLAQKGFDLVHLIPYFADNTIAYKYGVYKAGYDAHEAAQTCQRYFEDQLWVENFWQNYSVAQIQNYFGDRI